MRHRLPNEVLSETPVWLMTKEERDEYYATLEKNIDVEIDRIRGQQIAEWNPDMLFWMLMVLQCAFLVSVVAKSL